jgi:phage repressor protein C with HTH and peptisase S24 domain
MDKKLIINKIQDAYLMPKDGDFAEFLGISRQSLSNWKSRNTYDIELLYTKCLNINPVFLLTGEEPIKLISEKNSLKEEFHNNNDSQIFKLKTDEVIQKQSVPLYDIQASASVVSLFKDHIGEKPIDHITIPNLPKCDGAIYVSGDSMYPLLKSGDIIMYKKVENALDAIFWGEMYLVSITNDYGDEFVMVKWLHRSEQGQDFVKLVSENRHHQPTEFHIKNIKGLALIKASVRINSMY